MGAGGPTGGATSGVRCRMLGIAVGSPAIVRRWLAVQACRRLEPLVLAVTVALSPCFTEPVGGEK